jgi:hypothetical protein
MSYAPSAGRDARRLPDRLPAQHSGEQSPGRPNPAVGDDEGHARTARGELTVATPQNAYKMRKSSHGDVMLPVTVHLPNVKIGCQKLKGQKRIEMKYCTQLWSDVRVAAVDGIWGGAVLWKTPIRM